MKYRAALQKLVSKILQLLGALVVLFFIMIIVVILNRTFILEKARDFLVVSQTPNQSDVIIVLSGNAQAQRVDYGISLFKKGFANKLLLSGGPPEYGNISCPQVMMLQAIDSGVPKDAILLEEESQTTYENAEYCLKIVQSLGYRSVIVVTSDYHTRRARVIFDDFFKNSGIGLTVVNVPNENPTYDKWWQDDRETQNVVTEYMKFIWHYFFFQDKGEAKE